MLDNKIEEDPSTAQNIKIKKSQTTVHKSHDGALDKLAEE